MSVIRNLSTQKTKQPSGYMELFMQFSEGRGITKHTLATYRNALKQLLNNYEGGLFDARSWKQAIAKTLSGKNEAYYNKQLTAFRHFFAYMMDEYEFKSNPAMDFKYKRHTHQIVMHSEESIRKLLSAIDRSTFSGLRDYCFCLLLLDTGLRPSEALQLRIADVNFETNAIRVRKEYAKTRQERYLPASVQAIHLLKKLVNVRPEDWREDIPILCTYDGRELPTRSIRPRFEDYSRQIGQRITPYHLRHTFALYFVRNGGDSFALQRIMGHTKMDMTKLYVNLADSDIGKKHKEASPLKNFIGNKRIKKLKKI